MFFLYTVTFFAITSYITFYYLTRNFKYWKSRNIPGPQPLPFFGNYKKYVLRMSTSAEVNKQIYEDYPNEKVVGVYRMTRRSLLIRDLDIIKNVLIKDFEIFEDRGIEFSRKGLGANLLHSTSDIWRPLRNQFSPLFTTGKLKNMIPLISERVDIFVDHIKRITKIQKDQEIYSLFKKFTISSIAACAFGLEISADSDTLFKKLDEIDALAFKRHITTELDFLHPGVLKKLNISLYSKDLRNFFIKIVRDVIKARNGVPSTRHDFIDLSLELRNKRVPTAKKTGVDEYVTVTDDVIAAQAFSFYIGGSETNATTTAFMMYELAKNPSIQQQLIAEVDEALERHNGKITYEMLSELSYMDKVINETLRKYPVLDLVRCAKSNYNIPGTKVTIDKGITILVPLLGISHDEKYYPNPEQFDPERFSPENISKRHPCAYIPFGDGPRHCIGKLFAKIQSRIGLVKFLSNFRVEVSKNTPANLSLNPRRNTNSPMGGIYLNIVHRKRKAAQVKHL